MLPVQRVGIRELWRLLTDDGRKAGTMGKKISEMLGMPVPAMANGSANGHVGGKKLASRSR